VYCPGDTVEGWVFLEAYTSIPCRGVRCELTHTSRCAWYQSSGGDRTDFLGERVYTRAHRTVWGALHATDAVAVRSDAAGGAAQFDAAAGELMLPLSRTEGSLLALRVLRADAGRACLAACCINVDALLAKGTSGKETQLQLNMPSVKAAEAQLTVSATLSAMDDEAPDAPGRQGLRRVVLRVHSLRGLVGTATGESVSCQLYELDAAPAAGQPVPEPKEEDAELPMEICVPFRFTLPTTGLPSSLEYLPRELNYYNQGGLSHGFVRCNLDASVDTGIGGETITTRATITVVQPVPPSLPRLLQPGPPAGSVRLTVYPKRWFADLLPDSCLGSIGADGYEDRREAMGALSIDAALASRGVVAGGVAQLRLHAANGTPHDAMLRVDFVRIFSLRAANGVRYAARRVTRVLDTPLPAGSDRAQALPLRVPVMAPDFHGSRPTGADDEPLRWRTLLRVSAKLPGMPYGDPYVDLPLFVCGAPVGLANEEKQHALEKADMLPAAPKVENAKLQISMYETEEDHDAFDVVIAQSELDVSADVAAFAVARRSDDEETYPLTAEMAEPPDPAPKQGGRHRRMMTFRVGPPDKNAPQPAKNFAPSYFVARPAAPLRMASPHAPREALVDVAHRPPGALMLCPYTSVKFTVPYPPLTPF
jgi:hypothetical protein